MKYEKFTFSVRADQVETLEALLLEDFEGFEEQTGSLIGYRLHTESVYDFNPFVNQFMAEGAIEFSKEIIEDSDWNKIWESEFDPITIGRHLFIGAEHHSNHTDFEYRIVIQPKMAFGTGHHPTTYLMAQQMLHMDFQNKSVLDFGAGTGVLAILAEMMGAKKIQAIDNDPNSVSNMNVNFGLNNCKLLRPELGDIHLIDGQKFDIILANITRNIILERLSVFADSLTASGLLLCSGFFISDNDELIAKTAHLGLHVKEIHQKDDWSQITFEKTN